MRVTCQFVVTAIRAQIDRSSEMRALHCAFCEHDENQPDPVHCVLTLVCHWSFWIEFTGLRPVHISIRDTDSGKEACSSL